MKELVAIALLLWFVAIPALAAWLGHMRYRGRERQRAKASAAAAEPTPVAPAQLRLAVGDDVRAAPAHAIS